MTARCIKARSSSGVAAVGRSVAEGGGRTGVSFRARLLSVAKARTDISWYLGRYCRALISTEFLLSQRLFTQSNQLAEVRAHRRPVSSFPAAASRNRKAVELMKTLRVCQQAGRWQPSTKQSPPQSRGRAEIQREFARGSSQSRGKTKDGRSRSATTKCYEWHAVGKRLCLQVASLCQFNAPGPISY